MAKNVAADDTENFFSLEVDSATQHRNIYTTASCTELKDENHLV